MTIVSKGPRAILLLAMLGAATSLSAQEIQPEGDVLTVLGNRAIEGPEIEGIISARSGDKLQITTAEGARAVIMIDDRTEIRGKGGFLGMKSKERAASSLFNGLPVSIKTLRYENGLFADKIRFKNDDLKTAAMIHNGTDQRFLKQAAATEALRSRMGDIDKYNVKGTTNVYFDSGKYKLSAEAERDLCTAASEADAMDNALLLVVGYTDSTGSYEVNQALSEKRAARVVNYLQQACGWKPYRMLTPTGMAEADPAADNETEAGKAQNRRVAVNILVSKGLDGL
ncbi:OmpA family protein [Croceicoccus sediminis]|uniref:OmpA family protein n=1 Tax=Croceicoccus sediminis TaxID=2571150 RepID=UPI00118315EE|nr:OmpA family protein [Croceicoccus sediminis]